MLQGNHFIAFVATFVIACAVEAPTQSQAQPDDPAVAAPDLFDEIGASLWSQVESGTYVESELDAYFELWWNPRKRKRTKSIEWTMRQPTSKIPWYRWRGSVLGSVKTPSGVIVHRYRIGSASRDVLGRARPHRWQPPKDQWWFWTGDALYQIEEERWFVVEGTAQYRPSRNDSQVSPPQDLLAEFGTAMKTPSSQREQEYAARIERLVDTDRERFAALIVGYMLSLPEVSDRAYWLAAEVAARVVGQNKELSVQRVVLAFEELQGRKALDLSSTEPWPRLTEMLKKNLALRYVVYERWVMRKEASALLQSISLDTDMSRTIGCDWDVDECEDIKELHEDLVVRVGDKMIMLATEVHEWPFEPTASTVDVHGRLFIATGGVAYEVDLQQVSKRTIGPADSLGHEGDDGFPFVMSVERGARLWEISEYDGEHRMLRGCYALPKDEPETVDFFWRFRKRESGFLVFDPVTKRRIELEKVPCLTTTRVPRGKIPGPFSPLQRAIAR